MCKIQNNIAVEHSIMRVYSRITMHKFRTFTSQQMKIYELKQHKKYAEL